MKLNKVKINEIVHFEIKVGFNRICYKPLSCKNCPLIESLLIEPDYSEFKSVIFVGEGPGRDERKLMKPFTGLSGSLLRSVVKDVGLERYGVAYSNLALCEDFGELDEENKYEAVECCQKRLEDEIEKYKPQLVVPAGNLAKSFFLPNERGTITKVAGKLYSYDDGYSIIPILHPAYVLRNYKVFESLWDQVNEAKLFFISEPNPYKVYRPGFSAFEKLGICKELSLDTETTTYSPFDSGTVKGYNNKLFERGKMLCFALCGDGKTSYVFDQYDMQFFSKNLKELLNSKDIIYHHGQFDTPFMNSIDIYPNFKHDTMLMSYSMDESPSHPLKRLSRRHLGLEDWSGIIGESLDEAVSNMDEDAELEEDEVEEESYALVEPSILQRYCGQDTGSTKSLKDCLSEKMSENDWRIYNNVLMPTANTLINTYNRGIRIDILKLMHLKRKWENEKQDIVKELQAFGITKPNSPYQVMDAVVRYEIDEEPATSSKKMLLYYLWKCNTEGNTKGAEFLGKVIEYRELTKALGTFLCNVAKYAKSDGRVHPNFKLTASVTGRLASGDVMLLNYPRTTRLANELRSIYIPDPGNVWAHWDQKNFELRIYAVMNQDQGMIDIFLAGRDVHEETGILVYGKEGYKKLYEDTFGAIRVKIKTVVFGRIYLRGIQSIAEDLTMTVEATEEFCGKIDALWKGITDYRNGVWDSIMDNQELVNPLGRTRRFPLVTEDNAHKCWTEGVNFPIQSTANDFNLMGLNETSKISDELYIMFPIHDSAEGQCPEKEYDYFNELVSETLVSIPRNILNSGEFRFVVDGGVGYNWTEAG